MSDCGRYKNTAKARKENKFSKTRLSTSLAGFLFSEGIQQYERTPLYL
jgi:hypothetical protein